MTRNTQVCDGWLHRCLIVVAQVCNFRGMGGNPPPKSTGKRTQRTEAVFEVLLVFCIFWD